MMQPRGPPAQTQAANRQNLWQTLNESSTQPRAEAVLSLSAANLQEHSKAMHEIDQARVNKSINAQSGNRVPPAPTSPQPPFTFKSQSPQGVPTKYADRPNELKQDGLRLPPNKKRKNEQPQNAASAPAQTPNLAALKTSSEPAKISPPGPQRLSTEPLARKCLVSDCEAQGKTFASQADLDKHMSEVHDPKEPVIEDPLQWALEKMRFGLGLDENGKSKPQTKELVAESTEHEATKMMKSISAQGQPAIKQETATQIIRTPTHPGPSPSSSHLKTPRALVNTKPPVSSIEQGPKDSMVNDSTRHNDSVMNDTGPIIDFWADSPVKPEMINAAWAGLSEFQCAGPWNVIQSNLTPASTLSSNKSEKNSPRVSDISENDNVKIKLTMEENGSVPSDWLEDQLGGNMEALVVNSDFLAMKWENAFDMEDLVSNKSNNAEKIIHGKVDDLTIDNSWLELYAADRIKK